MNTDSALLPEHLLERARQIKLLLLDVDGVLTDGRLYFSNNGNEMKSFHTLDGQGIKLLRHSGVEVGIITGRKSELVENRARDLGIYLLKQGREDKFNALQEMLQDFSCPLENIAYVGDDLPDLSVMTRVGLAIGVANAHAEVIARSQWQTSKAGGQGAVREVCDAIMQAQNSYHEAIRTFLGE